MIPQYCIAFKQWGHWQLDIAMEEVPGGGQERTTAGHQGQGESPRPLSLLWGGEAGGVVAVCQWQEEPHVDHRPRTDPDPQGRGGADPEVLGPTQAWAVLVHSVPALRLLRRLWSVQKHQVGCEGSEGDWGPSSMGHSGWWGRQRQGWGHRLGLLHGFRWIGWGLIDYSADLEDSDDNWLHDGFCGCKLRLKGRHNPTISNQTETEMISNEWRCCVHLYTLFVVLLMNENFFPWGHHV